MLNQVKQVRIKNDIILPQLHTALINYFHEKEKSTVDPKVFILRSQKQSSFEKKYIQKKQICHITYYDLAKLNKDILMNSLMNHYYDFEVMESMRCIMDLIIDSPIDDKNINNDPNLSEKLRIHNFIRDLHQFGDPSANGLAIRASINDRPMIYTGDLVVIKSPQDPKQSNELFHEIAVGFVLNELRKEISNFSYAYDIFTCSSPIIDPENKKILMWCLNNENSAAYAVYENINNSKAIRYLASNEDGDREEYQKWKKSLSKLFPDLIIPENTNWKSEFFLLYYMQVLFALNYAHERFDFTHYDCHDGNVLIRQFSEEAFYVPFPHKGKKIYLLSPGSISTFIDYGFSHVSVTSDDKVTNLGVLDNNGQYFRRFDISAEKSHLIGDAYKLLCFMIKTAITEKNDQFIYIGAQLLSFFYGPLTIDQTIVIINEQRKYFYYLPQISQFEYSFEDFIKYVTDIYATNYPVLSEVFIVFETPTVNLFGSPDSFHTPKEEIKNSSVIPTFFEVYDARNSKGRNELIQYLLNSFQHSYDLEIHELSNYLQFKLFPFIEIPKNKKIDETYSFINKNYNLLVRNIDNRAKLIQNLFFLRSQVDILTYLLSINEIVENNDRKNSLQKIKENVLNENRKIENHLNEIIPSITDAIDLFDKIEIDFSAKNVKSDVRIKDLKNRYDLVHNGIKNM